MKKTRREPSKAKSLVMRPLFSARIQKPAKGKGSYNRKAPHKYYDGAFLTA